MVWMKRERRKRIRRGRSRVAGHHGDGREEEGHLLRAREYAVLPLNLVRGG